MRLRLRVTLWPDWVAVPAIVRLDAALRLAAASVATLYPVRLASGSGVALAAGTARGLEAVTPPHAAAARQLVPAAAIAASRMSRGGPWNVVFSSIKA